MRLGFGEMWLLDTLRLRPLGAFGRVRQSGVEAEVFRALEV